MRMILESLDGDNYMEFLLLTKEVQALSSQKIVSMMGEVGDCMYQIGIRSASPSEINEIFETSQEEEVPTIKSGCPGNKVPLGTDAKEMELAGLKAAGKSKKEKKAKKKSKGK